MYNHNNPAGENPTRFVPSGEQSHPSERISHRAVLIPGAVYHRGSSSLSLSLFITHTYAAITQRSRPWRATRRGLGLSRQLGRNAPCQDYIVPSSRAAWVSCSFSGKYIMVGWGGERRGTRNRRESVKRNFISILLGEKKCGTKNRWN